LSSSPSTAKKKKKKFNPRAKVQRKKEMKALGWWKEVINLHFRKITGRKESTSEPGDKKT
jgi:hypothetical protein